MGAIIVWPFFLTLVLFAALVLVFSTALTYIAMLATSAPNLSYMFSKVREKEAWKRFILHIVFHFFFCP